MQTFDPRRSQGQLAGGASTVDGGAGAAHPSPLILAHRLLRGRYLWALVLGTLLAAPLAWLGYKSKTPMYTSEGVVAIFPTQTQVLVRNEVNEAIPFFDQYVERQASLLGGESVRNIALNNPDVIAAGWPTGTRGIAALDDAMSVDLPRRGGLLLLRVSHQSPAAAKAACAAVLSAYEDIHQETTEREYGRTDTILKGREDELLGQLNTTNELIRGLAEEHGTDDLQPMIDGLNREVLALEVLIAQINSELAGRGAAVEGGGTNDPADPDQPAEPVVPVEQLTVEELATRDNELTELVARRDVLSAQIAAFSAQFSPRHSEVRTRQAELRTVEQLILTRAAVVRARWDTGTSPELASVTELRVRLGQCTAQRDDLMSRMRDLAEDQSSLLAHKSRLQTIQRDLTEVQERRQGLDVERQRMEVGRIQIQQNATTPIRPSSDKRLMFAAAGGGLGMAIGVAAMAGLGLLRGGFRFIDEFDGDRDSLLLGVVPDLGGKREPTPEAALCIHHARALLERRVPLLKDRGRIIGFTSPTAGDGKTTVCCSLATSFAMAGFKTVVMDADFVGRGMTSRLGMDRAPGLSDVLAGGDLQDCLAPGGTPNLSILSAGREEMMPADRIAASAMAPLLADLARRHDIVLVDSGPVLGSIEATVVVGLADGVLCVVSRGQSQKMFSAMRRKLRSLGADLVGVVFNRAYPKDFAHSTHTSVVSAQSQRSRSVQVPDFVTMGNRGMAGRLADDAPNEEAKARSA